MKRFFTLIELIVVIAVLGILAAIIIPNISNFQEEANDTAINSNIRNLQTSVDMYGLENHGGVPTENPPKEDVPQPINFNKIYPDYTRDLPETEGVNYWVDFQGKVWGSTIDSPSDVIYNPGELKWTGVENAAYYNIFKVVNSNSSSSIKNKKTIFVQKLEDSSNSIIVTTLSNLKTGEQYLVSAVDNKGFESAPAGTNYNGYVEVPFTGEVEGEGITPISSPNSGENDDLSLIVEGYGTFSVKNGTLYGWGYNGHGELGLGNTSHGQTPTQVTFFNDKEIVEIEKGTHFSLFRTSDGKVYASGYNVHGNLGVGDTTARFTPVEITFFADKEVVNLESGHHSSFAQTADGKIYAWGHNSSGTLGVGDDINKQIPVEVTFFNDKEVVEIETSGFHVLARTSDGKVYSWGQNTQGQLGISNYSNKNTPSEVVFFSNKDVVDLNAGLLQSFAKTSDGKLYAWGNNSHGELGIGNTTSQITPVEVTFFTNKDIVEIDSNYHYAIGRTSDGKVYAWGYNGHYQLGNGNQVDQTTPQEIASLSDKGITNIEAGYLTGFAQSSDGKVYGWGYNGHYSLGLGHNSTYQSTPIELPALSQ